jgi:hypothetical protein
MKSYKNSTEDYILPLLPHFLMMTLHQGELILQYCEMKQACLANRSSERCGLACLSWRYKGWMLHAGCRIAVQCFVVVASFFARTSLLISAHGGGGQVVAPTRRSYSKCFQKFRHFGCKDLYNIFSLDLSDNIVLRKMSWKLRGYRNRCWKCFEI